MNGTAALTWRYRDSGQARLDVGIRAGAAPRARDLPGQSFGRLPRLGREPGRRTVLRRQGRGLRVEARRPDGPAALLGRDELEGPGEGQLGRGQGVGHGVARHSVHRLHGPELEGHRLGADRRRVALQAQVLDHRGRAARHVLPVRQAPALHRRGHLPGGLEPEVRMEGRSARHPPGDGLEPDRLHPPERQGRLQPGLEPGVSVHREHQAEPRHRRRHQVEPDRRLLHVTSSSIRPSSTWTPWPDPGNRRRQANAGGTR